MRLLGLLLLVAVVSACGDQYATLEPKNPTKAADGLVVTRADGSSYRIEDAVASCVDAEQKPGVQVLRLTAPASAQSGARRQGMFMVEVAPGTTGTFHLPLQEREYDAGPSDVSLFVLDPRRRNELDGSLEESRGQITVRESTCDPEPQISVTLDTRLGSETGLAPVHVRGGMASSGR